MSHPLRFAWLLMAALSAAAHAEIGTVTFKAGDVSIQTAAGAARAAIKGAPINEGDTIVVGPVSTAQLKMVDGGVLALRPETQMKFDQYKWTGKEDGTESGVMSLVRGGFRTITGAIGRLNKGSYKVTTPNATLGIRGTDHEVAFIPPPVGVPLAGAPAPGTYDKVNVGATSLTSQGVTIVVRSNQVGFAPPAAAPQILPAVPAFMRSSAAPRPAQAGGQAQSQGGTSQGSSEPVRSASVVDSPGQVAAASDTAVKASDATPIDASTVVAVSPVAVPAATATSATTAEATTVPILLTSTTGTSLDLTAQVTTTAAGTTTAVSSGVPVIKIPNSLAASYFFWSNPGKVFGPDDQFRSATFDGLDAAFAFSGPNGNFSSATGDDEQLILSGNLTGASSVTTLASGISFGRYASGSTAAGPSGAALTVSGKDQSSFTNRQVVGTFHWIYGPALTSVFASAIQRGTATYSVSGSSAPTDQNNMSGTFNTAALSVDFDRQSVNTSLSVSMPVNTFNGGSSARNWTAVANNIRLDDGGGFSAGSSTANYAHNNVSVTLNGSSSTSTLGSINGQLTGALSAATLTYTLGGADPFNGFKHEHVNGVVGFGSPSLSSTAFVPSYLKLTARGSISGLDATTGAVSSSNPAAKFNGEFLTLTRITELDAGRTKIIAGQLVEFDGRTTLVSVNPNVSAVAPFTCNVNAQCFTSDLPSRVGIIAAGSAASGVLPAMPSISGAATVVESGADAVTGAIWGRYSNGNFALVDRITGSPIGSGTTTLGPVHHYMLLPQQTSAMVLPTTGSFNYTFVGGTSPTDTTGAVGTLNSATLFANFLAQTVNVSVGAAVGGRTWGASASNVPILAKTGFQVSKDSTGGSLAVTCGGCASTQLAGQITGGFGGPTGEAAGIAYSLNAGGVPPGQGGTGVTMGGVAAFRR